MMKIKIAETAQKHGVKSAYGLQKALSISPTIAARLWKGDFDKIGIKTLERLCDYFKCQTNDFLEYPLTLSGNTQSGKDVARATQLSNTELRNESDNETGLISVADVMARIKKSETRVLSYIHKKHLKADKSSGNWKIQESDYQDFINSEFFKTLKKF
jgi:DNA-binding Xre family transcriptional regulator